MWVRVVLPVIVCALIFLQRALVFFPLRLRNPRRSAAPDIAMSDALDLERTATEVAVAAARFAAAERRVQAAVAKVRRTGGRLGLRRAYQPAGAPARVCYHWGCRRPTTR